MTTERRAVRATATFFEDLDRQLSAERGPDGQPSTNDFQVFDLFRIVETFATQFDEHGIAEIADVPQAVLAEFSTRTAAVARRIDDKPDRFIETMGREPAARERWRLERKAATDSRPAKTHAADAQALHDGWAAQTRQLGLEPAAVVEHAIGEVAGLAVVD
ncbi:MAG TPA: relaxase domain-containing protein [Ilumatobacteraceae bacterium]|nr:relaxase domain-containing protein [Ilumatobacteraceae bacterium]HQZ34438.1 relaxase domain-containing protein [Ilumatobacteraceae bacterium]